LRTRWRPDPQRAGAEGSGGSAQAAVGGGDQLPEELGRERHSEFGGALHVARLLCCRRPFRASRCQRHPCDPAHLLLVLSHPAQRRLFAPCLAKGHLCSERLAEAP